MAFFSELKVFLQNLKEYWVNKQREVDDRFLELDSQLTAQEPKTKKWKRGKKEPPQQQYPSDPFAKYAAELEIEFFTKVCLITEWFSEMKTSCTISH